MTPPGPTGPGLPAWVGSGTTEPALRPSTGLRASSLRLAFAALLIGTFIGIIPLVPHMEFFAMAAAIPAALTVYLVMRRRQERFDPLEILIPYSTVYFLYFGVSSTWHMFNPGALPNLALYPYMRPATALAVLGYLCFLTGYAVSFKNTSRSRLAGLAPTGLAAYLFPGILGFVAQVGNVMADRIAARGTGVSAVVSAIQQLNATFFFAWFLVWHFVFSTRGSRGRKLLLLSVFVPMAAAVMYLTVGGKGTTIVILGFPALAFWYARRRFPVKTVTVVVLVSVFLVFPIYNTYRNTEHALTTSARLDRTMLMVGRWDPGTYLDNSLIAFMRRLGIVTSTAAVLRSAGRWVDFCYGETLLLGPVSLLIPRAVWPDKPLITIGRKFGETFDLVSELDVGTQIAATSVGELYWNFHLPGVVLGMFLIGAAFRWFYKKYGVGHGYDPIRTAVYIYLLLTAVQMEGSLGATMALTAKSIAVLLALIFLLRRIGAVGPVAAAEDERVGT